MMVEWEGQHPDEGSIQAWLDGALDASEAAQVEAHVAECATCASRVAEARGLIAGASRVVGLLDETPAPLIRPAVAPAPKVDNSLWRLLRVTPTRASIAAILLVAIGLTLTRNRAAVESVAPTASGGTRNAPAEVTASAPIASAAPMKDGLLDSAIARRLASEHPLRKLEPAPGAAVPTPSANEVAAAAAPDASAPARVAAAKASIQAQRDSSGPPADRARVGFRAGASVAADRAVVGGRAAEGANIRDALSARVAGVSITPSQAGQCYRLESTAGATQWGSVTLPLIIAFDSSGTLARVLTPTGGETETRAVATRVSADSLVLRLRRIGYDGTLALIGNGDARAGVMRSSQITTQLSEVVTPAAGEAKPSSEARAKRSDAPAQVRAAAPSPVPARAMPAGGRVGTEVPVTAHVISCPQP